MTNDSGQSDPQSGPTQRTLLLIGGTGYVGDRMRYALRDAGWRVRLLTRSGGERFTQEGFDTAPGDVTNRESLVAATQDVDAVVNLVALIREQGDATFEAINYQGSVNAIDAAKQARVRRFVQMSALGAGNLPDFPYFYTKWRAEQRLKESGLDWTIFRPSIVFGPGEKVQFVSQMADLVKQAPVIPIVGDGRSLFQPIHLDDVAAAFVAALDSAEAIGKVYEIAGPEVLTYEEVVDETAAALGKRKRKAHVPVALMMPAAAVMGAIPFIEAPVTTDQLKMLKIDNVTNDNAIPRLLGREPIRFRGNIGYVADT